MHSKKITVIPRDMSITESIPGKTPKNINFNILTCIALIAIVFAVYVQAGEHQFLDYDDGVYVTENGHVSSGVTGRNILWAFTSVYAGNWHPVTWLSHMADVHCYSMSPREYHRDDKHEEECKSVLIV